jgi:hypothetical protein
VLLAVVVIDFALELIGGHKKGKMDPRATAKFIDDEWQLVMNFFKLKGQM